MTTMILLTPRSFLVPTADPKAKLTTVGIESTQDWEWSTIGEHELSKFKARAKEKGQVKLIDTARLDASTDSFLATLPSLQLKDVRISEESIGSDPLPPGEAWVISPGGTDDHAGLYQVNIIEGPGSGVKILNQPVSPPFGESVRCAEQNLYVRAKELVGERDPR